MTRSLAPEGPGWVRRGAEVRAPLLLPRLPPEAPFGLLGQLLSGPGDPGAQIEILPLPPEPALRTLEETAVSAEAELGGSVPPPPGRRSVLEREAESARSVGRSVASREQRLFRVGLALYGRGRTPEAAERSRSDLDRRLVAAGFRTRVPWFEAGPVFSELAEARRPEGYWHLLPTAAAAAFYPFVDGAVLEPGGVLVGLALEDAAPVLLNRWSHASHSWGIFGTTGSGKSFAAALLATRSRWMRPELSIAVVDPLGEFGGWARELGGSVLRVGPGAETRLNPLAVPRAPGSPAEERPGRVAAFFSALFPSLRDEETALLDRSLERLYARTPEPTLSELLETVLQDAAAAPRLAGLLETFRSGSLRHLDGPTTARLDGNPLVIELTGVAPEHRAFHLAYLLDTLAARLEGAPGPKLLVVDEAHLLVQQPRVAAYLDALVRRVRHSSAGLLLLSQSPDDFLQSEHGRSVLRNLRANLLLRLPIVSPEVQAAFELTAGEVEWLPRARLPREAGYSEGLLRVGSSHISLALVASTPEYEFLSRSMSGGARGDPASPADAPANASLSPSPAGA
jgi:hypothetical protein